MPNTITRQTILDGANNVVVKVHIQGDGTGEETATALVTASTLSPPAARLAVESVQASLTGFSANLLWDDATDIPFQTLAEGDGAEICFDPRCISPAAASASGNMLFSTTGLGNGDRGTITITMKKVKYA